MTETGVMLSAKNGRKSQTLPLLRSLNVTKPFDGQVTVTVECARWALSMNASNRRPRRTHIEYLKDRILTGEWQEDHPSPIVFSEIARLIDGQHRIFAIVESGVAVTAHVRTGVRDELQQYMDLVQPRALEDRCAFMDDYSRNQKAAQLINLWFLTTRPTGTKVQKPSPSEAWHIWSLHKDAIEFGVAYMSKKVKGLSKSAIALALAEMFERDATKAEEFGESLVVVDGEVQQARVLRDWLFRRLSSRDRKDQKEQYRCCISAMKAYLENREIKTIRAATW